MPSEAGTTIGAAIAASLTIPPDAVRTVTFSLAWDCPDVNFTIERTYHRWVAKRVLLISPIQRSGFPE